MSGSVVNLAHILAASYQLAFRAGKVVRTVYDSGKLGIIDKAGCTSVPVAQDKAEEVIDSQTLADRLSQSLIVSSLHKLFPDVRIVGEESDIEVDEKQSADDIELSLFDSIKFPDSLKSLRSSDLTVWVGERLLLGPMNFITRLL